MRLRRRRKRYEDPFGGGVAMERTDQGAHVEPATITITPEQLSERRRLSLLQHFINGETPLDADHLNAIVEELLDLRRRVAALEQPELFSTKTARGG